MANETSMTFKLFGHDVSASKALKGVGASAKIAGGVLAGLGAMEIGKKLASFAGDTVAAFGELGGQTLKVQRYMGGTAEDASRLAHAFTMTGVDTDTATKALGIFSKFSSGAAQQLDTFRSKQAAAAQAGKPFHGVLTGSAAAIAQLGVKLRDSSGEMRPTSALLVDMAEQISKMPPGVDKTAFVLKAFGKNGMAMLPFLNKGAAGVKELMKQSDELGTTLSGKDLDAVKENTKAKRTWGEAVKGLQVSVGRELYPILTKFTSFLTTNVVPIIRTVIQWMKEHKDIVTLVGGAIGVVIAGFKLWSLTMAVFNAIAAANPIALVVIAIAALVAAVIYAYNNFEGFRNVVQAVWGAIKTAISFVVQWFQQTAWPILQRVIGFIVAYYRFLFGAAKVVWSGILSAISAVVQWFSVTAWPIIRKVIGFIAAYYQALWNTAKTVWGGIWTTISGVLDKIGEGIATLKGVLSTVWDGVAGAAKAAWNGVASAWNGSVGQLSWTVPDWVPIFGGSTISVPHIPMLAAGGIVTRPMLAMVGEAGPEAVVPLSSGGRYGIGGGRGDVHVHVNGLVAGSTDQLAREIAKVLRDGQARGVVGAIA